MNAIVIDTETTGFDKEKDELLQVSIIDEEGNTLFDEYVCPERVREWPEAQNVNQITPEFISSYPCISVFKDQLQRILQAADLIIGFNTQFDLGFLAAADITPRDDVQQVDVMREFAPIYGEWSTNNQNYRWKSLWVCAEYYGYDWAETRMHNSLADTKATLHCYKELLKDKNRIEERRMKIAVAYFSRADENYFGGKMIYVEKGNTEIAAGFVKELCDADEIKLIMEKPYAPEYRKCVEEAKQHLMENARPALVGLPESIAEYDAIVLGYPNYCGTIPMPVATFLETYDFTGKRILPFCTNEGSGMGNSVDDIKKLVPDAKIGESLPVFGSRAADAKPEIEAWLRRGALL